MQVEDTKDRVFIHDLDSELAEDESDDQHPIFLAGIEKRLLKLPKHILFNDQDRQRMESMQMVLYTVPTSLTVPEEQDSVRRAVLETRRRLRERQPLTIPKSDVPTESFQGDPDAMDLE